MSTSIEKPRILLTEDDTNLAFVVQDNLEQQGFVVMHCADGEQAAAAFSEHAFDLCLLDVMMPLRDGFSLASHIRQLDAQIPILFLTAKSLKEDRIAGLSLGADDYITKPFSIEELILRMRVFLRRRIKEPLNGQEPVLRIGRYVFDHPNLSLLSPSKQVKRLTQKEAELLALLVAHEGQVVRRETILQQVWQTDDYFAGRSMDVFISKLRKYLADDPSVEIVNYHGTGFRLNAGA